MPFRANESAETGAQEFLHFFTRSFAAAQRSESQALLRRIIEKYGPVVSAYPHWHPLVSHTPKREAPVTTPSINILDEKGFTLLDHTRYLRNGFVTCPYDGAEKLIKWVQTLNERERDRVRSDEYYYGNAFPLERDATIQAEILDFQLYNENATPVLVTCHWDKELDKDGYIPASIAVPRLLEMELPCRHNAQVAETWETMRSYILGQPNGARSSLFVNAETGQKLKRIWTELMASGAYGELIER